MVVEHASRPWTEKNVWGQDLEHYLPGAPEAEVLGYPTPPPPFGSISNAHIIGQSIRVARCECKECKTAAVSQELYLRLKFSEYSEIDPVKVTELTEHQYLLLPSHMFAFILKDRAYGK